MVFAQLEDAAWRLPPAVVLPSNAKEPIGLDDGRRDAHVVFGLARDEVKRFTP